MITIPTLTETSPFLGECLDHYEQLLAAIHDCMQRQTSEEVKIQDCFEVAGAYREKIVQLVRSYTFSDRREEIFFFKHVKPLFTAKLEFYTYRYQLILFQTKEIEKDQDELRRFYERQLFRKAKLKKDHPGFYDYVAHERTDADEKWFTRSPGNKETSMYDVLMGKYLAILQFEEFMRTKYQFN
jgi:hypothetical protein